MAGINLNPAATVSRITAAAGVSPKVSAAAVGGSITTIFWAIAAATWWRHTFSASSLAALTGATATVLSYAFGYFMSDPLREDGGQVPVTRPEPGPAAVGSQAAVTTPEASSASG